MPKIALISDTHRRHRELTIPACDLLIHAGDFCTFEKEDLKVLADADDWFGEVPAKKIISVAGNHDYQLENEGYTFRNTTLLHDRLIEWEGLSIYGSPWIPNLPGFAFHRSPESLLHKWQAIPSGIDILITHTAPWGILDMPSRNVVHLGCEHLAEELARIQPRLHVFGHIHASHGELHKDGTHFVNAAVVGGKHLTLRHDPIVVDL